MGCCNFNNIYEIFHGWAVAEESGKEEKKAFAAMAVKQAKGLCFLGCLTKLLCGERRREKRKHEKGKRKRKKRENEKKLRRKIKEEICI